MAFPQTSEDLLDHVPWPVREESLEGPVLGAIFAPQAGMVADEGKVALAFPLLKVDRNPQNYPIPTPEEPTGLGRVVREPSSSENHGSGLPGERVASHQDQPDRPVEELAPAGPVSPAVDLPDEAGDGPSAHGQNPAPPDRHAERPTSPGKSGTDDAENVPEGRDIKA